MRLSIHEVLTNVSKATTTEERAAILRQNNSVVLRQILQYNFHPECKFALPEGAPPFKSDRNLPVGMSDTNLFQEARRLYVFIEGKAPPGLRRGNRETLFINLLEGLHYTEADLIVSLKDKQLSSRYPGLQYFVVQAAFPDLLPEPTFGATDLMKKIENAETTKEIFQTLVDASVEIRPNAPMIVPRELEVAKNNPLDLPAKKPVNPKKVEACRKASEARRRNAAARREAKALAESQQS